MGSPSCTSNPPLQMLQATVPQIEALKKEISERSEERNARVQEEDLREGDRLFDANLGRPPPLVHLVSRAPAAVMGRAIRSQNVFNDARQRQMAFIPFPCQDLGVCRPWVPPAAFPRLRLHWPLGSKTLFSLCGVSKTQTPRGGR